MSIFTAVALPSLADMLERTNPAVVNIATRTTVVERNRLLADPFFRRFFNIPESRRRYRRTQSAGSGVVVDADLGYIVTNNHVVDGADEISVGQRWRWMHAHRTREVVGTSRGVHSCPTGQAQGRS